MQNYSLVIIGSECSGKTTLAKILAEEYSLPFLEETSRSYAKSKGVELSYSDVMPIALEQNRQEKDFLSRKSFQLKIFDTCLLSTLIYSEMYYGRCPDKLNEMIKMDRYDQFILCNPDPDWSEDGIRQKPYSRQKMHFMFKDELIKRGAHFKEISGPVEERKNMVMSLLETMGLRKF